MKKFTLCMVIFSAIAMIGTAWAGKDREASQCRLEIDLTDGSHVIGTTDIESIPMQTPYSKLDIALKQILTIKIAEDHENASIDLRNGDKLKGVITLEPTNLETIFGKVKIGLGHIRMINVLLSGGAMSGALGQGLVLYYSFDNDNGDRIIDQSGKRNDGVVKGAKWTPKGIRGGAYRFDGVDDFIDSGNSSLANGFSEVTLSVWACTSANVPYAGIATACSQNSKDLLMMSEGPAGKRQATFYVGNGARYDGVSAVPSGVFVPDTWHHLAGTWKSPKIGGDGLLRMYFDGILNSTSTQPLDGVISQTTSLKIGWDDVQLPSPENRRFNGLIDEVMIFNRALSDSEIKQIYDAQR